MHKKKKLHINNILITGASGNIALEAIRFLTKIDSPNKIIVEVRNVDKSKSVFKAYPKLDYVHFDLKNCETFDIVLTSVVKFFF